MKKWTETIALTKQSDDNGEVESMIDGDRIQINVGESSWRYALVNLI
jgi:hypothetical protein